MKVLEEATELAKSLSKAIVESGEEHQPIMIIITPSGINTMLLRGLDKNRFKQDIGGLLRQFHAYAYIFIDEAWSATISNDSPLIHKLFSGEISVSELPLDDRDEILTIVATENRKSYRCWTAKIKYTLDKRYLGEWEEMEGAPEGQLILKEW